MTSAERELEFSEGTTNEKIGTKLVMDAGDMRIWHIRLSPGESLAAHRHDRPYFWTVLTDGQGRSRYADGRENDIVYRAGDTKHFADLSPETGFVHDLTNTGDSDLLFVTVEFNR